MLLFGDEVGLVLLNLLDFFECEDEDVLEVLFWLEDVEGIFGEDFSFV